MHIVGPPLVPPRWFRFPSEVVALGVTVSVPQDLERRLDCKTSTCGEGGTLLHHIRDECPIAALLGPEGLCVGIGRTVCD